MGGIGSGGIRDGAGRKSLDGVPRQRVSVSVPCWLLKHLREISGRTGESVSSLIVDYIERGIRR